MWQISSFAFWNFLEFCLDIFNTQFIDSADVELTDTESWLYFFRTWPPKFSCKGINFYFSEFFDKWKIGYKIKGIGYKCNICIQNYLYFPDH